jgi:DNA-binding transcriptional ArsR family regulator
MRRARDIILAADERVIESVKWTPTFSYKGNIAGFNPSKTVDLRIVNAMANDLALDRTFAACAHPIRRQIIERLARREMTVGEATGDFPVSKPAISRHLRVLEDAGAIVRVVDGRTHRLRLSGRALDAASAWMDDQRAMWERKFAVVEQYLAEQAQERP